MSYIKTWGYNISTARHISHSEKYDTLYMHGHCLTTLTFYRRLYRTNLYHKLQLEITASVSMSIETQTIVCNRTHIRTSVFQSVHCCSAYIPCLESEMPMQVDLCATAYAIWLQHLECCAVQTIFIVNM